MATRGAAASSTAATRSASAASSSSTAAGSRATGHNGTYTGFAVRNRHGSVRGLHVTNQRGQSATLAHGWRREADGSRTWAIHGRGPDGRAGGLRWNSRTGWSRY